MKYDFDRPIDRWNNFAAKYDEMEARFGRRDLIPMWIADMDLMTAQPILDAIDARNRQGIFGYTSRPDSYFEAVCQWQEKRNGWKPDPALCLYTLGVVPALCTFVREFSKPGDEILFTTPVYGEFFDSVENWGRKCLTVPLKEENGYYSMDFEAFEEALKRRPPLFILCNPHNPVGRVWTADELRRMGELCVQYGTLIISDEIHSDLMLFGHKHIPMATVSEEIAANTITCTSATKTFNLAGLQAATLMFPNEKLRPQQLLQPGGGGGRLPSRRGMAGAAAGPSGAQRDLRGELPEGEHPGNHPAPAGMHLSVVAQLQGSGPCGRCAARLHGERGAPGPQRRPGLRQDRGRGLHAHEHRLPPVHGGKGHGSAEGRRGQAHGPLTRPPNCGSNSSQRRRV